MSDWYDFVHQALDKYNKDFVRRSTQMQRDDAALQSMGLLIAVLRAKKRLGHD